MPSRAGSDDAFPGTAFGRDARPQAEQGSATGVPPILHLTLYTGRRAWSIASVDAESTEANEPFWHCVSRLCQLLDLRRSPDPGGKENLAVLLARLQRCEDPQTLRRTASPLREWASHPAHAERASAFAAWITYVILPDMGIMDVPVSENLEEGLEMLE